MRTNTHSWPIYNLKTREKKIDTTPYFQRTPVWSLSQKQLLIDTILRGLDMPKMYLNVLKKRQGRFEYQVVDGQQRIRAIWDFYKGSFRLAKDAPAIKRWQVAGKGFKELPDDLQDMFWGYNLAIVLIEDAERDEIEDMFLRLQNGETLIAAEVRNAISGDMRDFVKALTDHALFKSVDFNNRRFAFDTVAAQVTALELHGGMTDVKGRDLEKMYREYRQFDDGGEDAKKIKKVLNFLAKAFDERTPELQKYNVLSLYWLVSELLDTYAVRGFERKVSKWFINFETRRREEAEKDPEHRDPEFLAYQEKISQAAGSRDSLRFRHEVLMTDFLLTFPNLELLDQQRSFTDDQRRAIFRKFKGICQVCYQKVKWENFHADHIKPHVDAGPSTVANGQLLCSTCNLQKSASQPTGKVIVSRV
jgi:hypothetical protein